MTTTASLSELINDVKNATASRASKQRDLIKLGLRQVDVDRLFAQWYQPRVRYTFGIELEVTRVHDRDAMISACVARGLAAQYEGYNHRNNNRYFKFVSDSSIIGSGAIECVSPILTEGANGNGAVNAICDALKSVGAHANASCGYHVHVGGDITDRQYVNVFINYQRLENVIDTFMAPSRRANASQWCRTLADHDFSTCATPDNVDFQLRSNRYHKVNSQAWLRHRTIEFRQHQGTTNARKARAWANFCVKLVAWSRDNRLTAPATSIDEIPFLTATEKRYFKQRAAALA